MNPRYRIVFRTAVALAGIWAVAAVGFLVARNARVTPDKVRAYAESVDLGKLTGADRAEAIRKLAAMLNALSLEERQSLRLDHTAYQWFEQMTEAEKAEFLEATLPTGFKQMLAAFEQMPEDRRRRTVDEALKRLKETRQQMAAGQMPSPPGTNAPIILSEELRQKVTTMGLQAFYSQSSAQTKAEMAPLLEEMQRLMESGRMLHGRPGR